MAVEKGPLTAPDLVEQRQSRINHDSIVLTASYGLTGAIGILFWVVAARNMTAVQLSTETAVVSVATAASQVAWQGIAHAFLSMMPSAGVGTIRLLLRGYLLVLVVSLFTGLTASLFAVLILDGLASVWWTFLSITLAAMVLAIYSVQDPVLTAFGKANWLLYENVPVSIAKLASLPWFAAMVINRNPALLATMLPTAVAVLVVSGAVVPRMVRRQRLEFSIQRVLRKDIAHTNAELGERWMADHSGVFGMFALRDGIASALSSGIVLILPFVVTALTQRHGPIQGGLFALCIQLGAGLDLITSGAAVSLVTNVTDDPVRGPAAAIRMWKRLLVLISIAGTLLVAGTPIMIWLWGKAEYRQRDVQLVIAVLALGSLLHVTYEVWIALLRAQGKTLTQLICSSFSSVALLTLVIVLARNHGALGAAIAIATVNATLLLVSSIGLSRARHYYQPRHI